jgi:putative transposase
MKIHRQSYTLEFKELAVKQIKDGQSFSMVAKELGINEQTLRNWSSAASRGALTDASTKPVSAEQMLALIKAIHSELKGTHGSPRMLRELLKRGFSASKARVERLMRENNVRARQKRRYKATTDSRHNLPVAQNCWIATLSPAHGMKSRRPTSRICGRMKAGWNLAIVLDLFSREIVGWSLKPSITAEIVTAALSMAWFRRRPPAGLIHHSDRGSQYASHAFQSLL